MPCGPNDLSWVARQMLPAVEVVLHRKERRGGAGGDVELPVDVLDVVAHRPR